MTTHHITAKKLIQILPAIARVSEDKEIDNQALFVYTVAALISDDQGCALEEDIMKAVDDPEISNAACSLVESLRQ